ncbi:MAG: hypothetical protein KDI65_08470 [Alphaproteobacteria bacterium]|nr:hypothetical protein [Alphaproteobacteria bacterium]
MKNSLFALAIITAVLCIYTPAARANDCPVSRPLTSVKSWIEGTRILRTKSAADMTEWQMGHKPTVGGGQILGLGGGEIEANYNTGFEVSPFPGGYCVVMQELTATFVAKPQIHVASNFEEGSCEYSEVLYHEQKHIDALRNFHLKHINDIKKKLREIASTIPSTRPVSKDKVSEVQHQLVNYVQVKINAYFQKIMRELQETQQKIDSPAEYKRVAGKCRKWEQKLKDKPKK